MVTTLFPLVHLLRGRRGEPGSGDGRELQGHAPMSPQGSLGPRRKWDFRPGHLGTGRLWALTPPGLRLDRVGLV